MADNADRHSDHAAAGPELTMASYPPQAYFEDTERIEPYHSYTHGMRWIVDTAGDFDGQAVEVDDEIYAVADPAREFQAVDEVTFAIWSPPAVGSIADLLQSPPLPHHGHTTGQGDWRFVVEIQIVNDSPSAWTDITNQVRGAEWTRGADEPYGRPRIGELALTLASPNDEWSPWNPDGPNGDPGFFAPGTLMRVGVTSPTETRANGWLPQITVKVDSWRYEYVGRGADRFVEIRAYETLRELSEVDEDALASVVGFDDWPDERIDRLLTAAEWPYGLRVDAPNLTRADDIGFNFWALQSTDMAQNRLAECYLTADSSSTEFRSDRTGAAMLEAKYYPAYDPDGPGSDPDVHPLVQFSHSLPDGRKAAGIGFDHYEHRETSPGSPEPNFLYVPYNSDSFVTSNEDAYVANDVTMSRTGGTAQRHQHIHSIDRYGRRTHSRTNLATRFDSVALFLARIFGIRRGLNTISVEEIEVALSDRSLDVFEVGIATDVGSEAYIYPPDGTTGLDRPRIFGHIRTVSHSVTPRRDAVTWTAGFSVDTSQVQGLPAAQLEATPTGAGSP